MTEGDTMNEEFGEIIAEEYKVDVDHVWSGTPAAMVPKWEKLYHRPGVAHATCRRCGCSVDDLTQHEEWHAQLSATPS